MAGLLNFDTTSIEAVAFKFEGASTAEQVDCMGTIGVETETTTIQKLCGKAVVKQITKPISMTVTVSAHVPISIFRQFYGIEQGETTKTGVFSYGETSNGKPFSLSAQLNDDFAGTYKLIGFGKARSQSGLTFTVENQADQVALLEFTATVEKDETGYWYHETTTGEATGITASAWLTDLGTAVKK